MANNWFTFVVAFIGYDDPDRRHIRRSKQFMGTGHARQLRGREQSLLCHFAQIAHLVHDKTACNKSVLKIW